MQKKTENSIMLHRDGATLDVTFHGDVQNYEANALCTQAQKMMADGIKKVRFATDELGQWDSSLLVVIFQLVGVAQQAGVAYDLSALPENLQDLTSLAYAVDRKPTHGGGRKFAFLERIGKSTLEILQKTSGVMDFMGAIGTSVWRFITFRSIMRRVDFCAALEDCGPHAIGIVALISFLVGLILAFVGAIQLQTFGAQIYVASLVTIGMCRIMGAIMVGIIMAGRTGSSYAATIGTMQVNEELDALQTMGLSKIDFLVLPRMLSLLIAMPILTMLSDFMGMVGGAFVGVFMMDLPYQEYWRYAFDAFNLKNFLVGVFHGLCFGVIISICGCYSGLNCGRNADSVGVATTQSVVRSIVWMIVATGIITVICMELGI